MSAPWNDWYHVTAHAYGSWLRGDPRGWRSRHHREHVDGDYKNPPAPRTYDKLHAYSKLLMKRDAVRIERDLRAFVLDCILDKLRECCIEVRIASLDGVHLHLLVRVLDHNPRHWIGLAKKHASHCVRQAQYRIEPGGLWGKRSHPEPVTDEGHFANTVRYITLHETRGAVVRSNLKGVRNDLADFDTDNLSVE